MRQLPEEIDGKSIITTRMDINKDKIYSGNL